MSYTWDSDGDTFEQLQERVLSNAFNSSRFGEEAKAGLNSGVLKVCRKLGLFRGAAILDYDADGLVTQPAAPFFKVETLWTADSSGSGTGDQAIRRYAQRRLSPLPYDSAADLAAGGNEPLYYTARRKQSPTTRAAELVITLLPCTTAGKVAIVGLQRPPIMDSADDVSGLGDELDEAIVAFAKARLSERQDDFQMANYWDGRFDILLREAADDATSDGPRITPGLEDDFIADRGR